MIPANESCDIVTGNAKTIDTSSKLAFTLLHKIFGTVALNSNCSI